MHNITYMERNKLELLNLASNSAQLQFYQVITLHINYKFSLIHVRVEANVYSYFILQEAGIKVSDICSHLAQDSVH